MQSHQPSLIARDDTMLGICQGLGEDLGISPMLLRIALGTTLLWSPLTGISAYAAMGVLVLFSRLIVREPRTPAPAVEAGPAPAAAEAEPEPQMLQAA